MNLRDDLTGLLIDIDGTLLSIAGGHAAGLRTALVRTGRAAESRPVPESDPDLVLASIADLLADRPA